MLLSSVTSTPNNPNSSNHNMSSLSLDKNTRDKEKDSELFGAYKLMQTIGEGEFAKVKYAIKQNSTTNNNKDFFTNQNNASNSSSVIEEVAVKLVKKTSLNTPQKINKLKREIQVLKNKNIQKHPYIVKLINTIENEKYIGLVLKYAGGGELFDYIIAHNYLKNSEALRLFSQLISGVEYLHINHIIHRDLKLENLMLDLNKNLMITDFGFANTFKHKYRDLMSTSCGSPCYAAPELVVSENAYSGSLADIWSCGVILYAMTNGYLPYDDDPNNPEGDNINLLYKFILNTKLNFAEYVHQNTKALIRRMLVPDPNKRANVNEIKNHKALVAYRNIVFDINNNLINNSNNTNNVNTKIVDNSNNIMDNMELMIKDDLLSNNNNSDNNSSSIVENNINNSNIMPNTPKSIYNNNKIIKLNPFDPETSLVSFENEYNLINKQNNNNNNMLTLNNLNNKNSITINRNNALNTLNKNKENLTNERPISFIQPIETNNNNTQHRKTISMGVEQQQTNHKNNSVYLPLTNNNTNNNSNNRYSLFGNVTKININSNKKKWGNWITNIKKLNNSIITKNGNNTNKRKTVMYYIPPSSNNDSSNNSNTGHSRHYSMYHTTTNNNNININSLINNNKQGQIVSLKQHTGAIDQQALTSLSPNEAIKKVKETIVGLNMEIIKMNNEYGITVIRRKKEKKNINTKESKIKRIINKKNKLFKELFSRNAKDQSNPTNNINQHEQQQQGFFEPNNNNININYDNSDNDNNESDNLMTLVYTDNKFDSWDEIKMKIEICAVRNFPNLFVVEIRRIKGNQWVYKNLYNLIVESLNNNNNHNSNSTNSNTYK